MGDSTRGPGGRHDGGDPRVTLADDAADAVRSGDYPELLHIAARLYAEEHPGLITRLDLTAPGVQSSDIARLLDTLHGEVSREVRRLSRIV